MKKEKYYGKWLLKSYTVPFVVAIILIMIISVVYTCYQKIEKQFCEERLRTVEAVTSKITISTYTRFDVQWTSLNYSVRILQTLESTGESNLFDELQTIEEALGLSDGDGMLYLFDENGYYYGAKGKIGLWNDLKALQDEKKHSLSVTNLPKWETHLGDYMMFFNRLDKPQVMDGIKVTHVALARDVSIFDDDLEIGNYGDVDSSYIIRENGTRIYHQSNNEIFANVYNVLRSLDTCRFEHGVTKEMIKQDIRLNQSGSAHVVYEDGDYIMAYQPLGIADWYVVYMVSLDSMSQDTREFIFQTVLLIGGASITLLVLCMILLNVNNYKWHLRQFSVNEQLRAAVDEAEQASNAKSDFLSRMSHDIRTPLNGIIGMTEIAKRNIDDPDKVNDCLGKIIASSAHLMLLINDVLDMSRIESGKIEMRCAPFNLKQVLNECVSMIEGHVVDHHIAFRCDYDGVLHNAVLGDENHLKQILSNILGNAVKFTPDGGAITFCVTEMPSNIRAHFYQFEISDTGIGMSEEYLEHIFEPFSQETGGPRTDFKGTGLGMSIVKKLVEQMQGEIHVESQKNKGSRFVILLSFNTVSTESIDKEEKAEEAVSHVLHGKILLAEDGRMNREIAEYLLEDAGITVISAEDGQQAVEIFSASSPGEFDAILMDIMMPVMDGLEATRIIRAMDRTDAKTIPIIAMTANAYREDEEKSMEAGMNAHMTKPIVPDEMIRTLKDFIERG